LSRYALGDSTVAAKLAAWLTAEVDAEGCLTLLVPLATSGNYGQCCLALAGV